MSAELANKLGFYYVIFQQIPNTDRVNCWIDGKDFPEIMKKDALVGFLNQLGYQADLTRKMVEAFTESSFFIWEVEEEKIRRLSNVAEELSIAEAVSQKRKELMSTRREERIDTQMGWKHEIDSSGNLNLLK